MICISKGITGGFLPLGITAISKRVTNIFSTQKSENTFFHGHSYTGNALSVAAALANMRLIHSTNIKKQIRTLVQLQLNFKKKITKLPNIFNARNIGTVIAFEFGGNNSSYANDVKLLFKDYCLKKGLYIRPLGNTVYFLPPYCITKKQISKAHKILSSAIKEIELNVLK